MPTKPSMILQMHLEKRRKKIGGGAGKRRKKIGGGGGGKNPSVSRERPLRDACLYLNVFKPFGQIPL